MSQRRPETNATRKPAGQLAPDEPSRAPTLRDLVKFLEQTERPDDQFGSDLEAIQAEQEPLGPSEESRWQETVEALRSIEAREGTPEGKVHAWLASWGRTEERKPPER